MYPLPKPVFSCNSLFLASVLSKHAS